MTSARASSGSLSHRSKHCWTNSRSPSGICSSLFSRASAEIGINKAMYQCSWAIFNRSWRTDSGSRSYSPIFRAQNALRSSVFEASIFSLRSGVAASKSDKYLTGESAIDGIGGGFGCEGTVRRVHFGSAPLEAAKISKLPSMKLNLVRNIKKQAFRVSNQRPR